MVDGAIESRGTAVGDDGFAQRRFADQHVVGRDAAVAAVDAEAGRGVALRIEIDDQHALADGGERRAEIDRRRGLADAALLVGDGEHARRFGRLGAFGQDDDLRIGLGGRTLGSWRRRLSIRREVSILNVLI